MSQTALELLRLLADDAPSELIDQQAAGGDADARQARELAHRVRAGMDTRRRREVALTALVDIARDLASLRDPGGVLDTIVRRARSLLGTDVTYLTLYDAERGDTYMRATSGSTSARFQALRLPTGAGLGGLVAQTRRPYWSADYMADARYRHTREIDAAVAEEGLVAICGTPLLVEGEFVGVLFASNRTRRPFSHDEVALLASLAALAAVSLVQTRQAQETQDALASLSETHTGIRQAAAAHDRFVAVVLAGGGVDDIAAALGELLDCWVVVLDVDGRRMAAHGAAPEQGPEVAGSGGYGLSDSAAVRASTVTGRLAGADGLWAAVVSAAGQRLGALVLGGRAEDLDSSAGRIVERAAMVTALVLLFRLRAAETDHRVRTDLLADLLAHTGAARTSGDPALVERGRLLGVRLREPHVLAVCLGSAGRRRGLAMAASAEVAGHGLACEHLDEVVVLIAGADPSAIAASLADRLSEADGGELVTVGSVGPVRPADGLRDVHAEARRTADALLALGTPGRGAAASDLGFAGLVVSGSPDVDAYLQRVLGPLQDYDARRGTDLLGTLETYYATGSSPRRAAGELHVHVNTISQRLDRISQLLGGDWQRPHRALDLQLALRLRALRGSRR